MRYKRSHLIGLFAALLVLVTILGGGILLVIKEDHASAGSTEGAAYHFQGTDQPQATRSHKYHTNLNHSDLSEQRSCITKGLLGPTQNTKKWHSDCQGDVSASS